MHRLAILLLAISLGGCSLARFARQSRCLDQPDFLAAGLVTNGPAAVAPGQLLTLDAELFSPHRSRQGYWAPLDFLREVGASIRLAEPFDPAKTPILFVHGAGGSPRDWRFFVERLDRERFQPWFFHYPSGASIPRLTQLLELQLRALLDEHHPQRVYVVAHSLGGLVARSFLGERGEHFPELELFVAISTPWGGERLAALAPRRIAAWSDLRPDSEFLRTLFHRRLPAEIEFVLFFGHRGTRTPLGRASDGVVPLVSELRLEAQLEADRSYGFDESHTTVLRSPKVWKVLERVLTTARRRPLAELQRAP